jgi:hypothetical protein
MSARRVDWSDIDLLDFHIERDPLATYELLTDLVAAARYLWRFADRSVLEAVRDDLATVADDSPIAAARRVLPLIDTLYRPSP